MSKDIKNQESIPVYVGAKSEMCKGGMHFEVGREFTSFQDDYTFNDLIVAKAVLLDLADALEKKLLQMAH